MAMILFRPQRKLIKMKSFEITELVLRKKLLKYFFWRSDPA